MQKSKQNYGRTMLEMLGVLAIIGILTAVGLSMYKNAIYSHKANIILNDARMIAATVLQKETIVADAKTYVISTAEYKPETSYDIRALEIKAKTTFAVEVKNVEEGVCKAILDKAGSNYSIEVQDTIFDGSNTNICQAENSVKFMFDLTGLCDPRCPTCCYGVCCASDQVCYDETHSCGPVCKDGEKPFGTGTVGGSICCPEETKSVCGKNCCEEESTCCGGKCCSSGECSDFETGECCGTDKNGVQLKGDREAKECICPGGMSLTDGACECPDGQIYVNGVCMEISCYTDEEKTEECTTSNCHCFLGNERCGYDCSPTGLDCLYGMCQSNVCDNSNLAFTQHTGLKLYGCLTEKSKELSGVICTKEGGADNYKCYPKGSNHRCGVYCYADGTNCYYGDCAIEKSKCEENNYGEYETYTGATVYGCSLPKNEKSGADFATIRGWSDWQLYKDGKACANGCTLTNGGFECGGGLCSSNDCTANGGTFDSDTKQCCYDYEEDDKYKKLCCASSPGTTYLCYLDNTFCGTACDLSGVCHLGLCHKKECPTGYTFKISGGRGLCYNGEKNPIGCAPVGNTGNYTCFRDGAQCSSTCTGFDAKGCEESCGSCPNGSTYGAVYMQIGGCKYADGLACTTTGVCYIYDNICGTGCKIDGSGCTDGKCLASECNSGQVLRHNGGTTGASGTSRYECVDAKLTCDNGTCSITGEKCGTGCEDDGTLCTTGICVASECPDSTHFEQITNQYYGCYSSTNGTSCYKRGSAYICYKNGKECGTGCMVDGTGCTSEGQTCVTTEET